MTDTPLARTTAVMLAWREQPILIEAVEAVLASRGVDIDVVLVDNGCTDGSVDRLRDHSGVTIINPGENTGFTGGCNLGARHAAGEFLVFVNGDAVVETDTIAHLVGALTDDVGLASASLRLYDAPETMNSAGNPIHYTGLSWAGGWGEPASQHTNPGDIASATGAAVAARADRFAEVGGFYEPMFAYCEDADLSLRVWQHGWRVVYVPEAVVLHHYEFSRNPVKLYLLERNRLLMVLTLFQRSTLTAIAPALIGLELLILLVAWRNGWAKQKIDGWRWLWKNRSLIRQRRSAVQAQRVRSDSDLAWVITGDFAPSADTGFAIGTFPRALSRGYWAAVKRLVLHAL